RAMGSALRSLVVAANGGGFAVSTFYNTSNQVIAIRPARAVTADCTAAATARLDGAFQQATATVDANGNFSFPHVFGFDADITCLDASGKVTERLADFAESRRVPFPSPRRGGR